MKQVIRIKKKGLMLAITQAKIEGQISAISRNEYYTRPCQVAKRNKARRKNKVEKYSYV